MQYIPPSATLADGVLVLALEVCLHKFEPSKQGRGGRADVLDLERFFRLPKSQTVEYTV